MRVLGAAAIAAAMSVLVGCGGGAGAASYDGWLILNYCHPNYGAHPRPTPSQRECADNTTAEEIRAMDTPRSRDAIGAAQIDAADEGRSIQGQ